MYTLEDIPDNVKISWTGHQTIPALTQAVKAEKITDVYVASSGISNAKEVKYKKHCEVTKLPGVPATINMEASQQEYEAHRNSLLALEEGQKRIVIFFGGDAMISSATSPKMMPLK